MVSLPLTRLCDSCSFYYCRLGKSTCIRRMSRHTSNKSLIHKTWNGAGMNVWRNLRSTVEKQLSVNLTNKTTGRKKGLPLYQWSFHSEWAHGIFLRLVSFKKSELSFLSTYYFSYPTLGYKLCYLTTSAKLSSFPWLFPEGYASKTKFKEEKENSSGFGSLYFVYCRCPVLLE